MIRFKNNLSNLLIALLLLHGFWSVLNYGYIAQDFEAHTRRSLLPYWPFDWSETNPPPLFWLGRSWFLLTYYWREAVSFTFIVINTFAVRIWHGIIIDLIKNNWIRTGAMVLITFLPARIIHAQAYAADAFMPIFTLLVLRWMHQLKTNDRALPKLSLCLAAAMFFKYSLIALIVPVFFIIRSSRGILIAFKAVSPAALLFLFEMLLAGQGNNMTVMGHWQWGQYGDPSKSLLSSFLNAPMGPRDLFIPRAGDAELFTIPSYFENLNLDNHRYSYPALLVYSTFTDPMNVLQQLPGPILNSEYRLDQFFIRTRSKGSHLAMILNIWLGAWFFCVGLTAAALKKRTGLYGDLFWISFSGLAIMLVGLPFFVHPVDGGTWQARFLIPSIVGFLIMGLAWLDDTLGSEENSIWAPKLVFLMCMASSLCALRMIVHL